MIPHKDVIMLYNDNSTCICTDLLIAIDCRTIFCEIGLCVSCTMRMRTMQSLVLKQQWPTRDTDQEQLCHCDTEKQ